jgi:hypothetical protein
VSFVTITLCIASQRVFIVASVYFVIDSVRKLLDTPSYLLFDVTQGDLYVGWASALSTLVTVWSIGLAF